MSRTRTVWRLAAILLVAGGLGASSADLPQALGPAYAESNPTPAQGTDAKPSVLTDELGPYYQDVLADWLQKGYKPVSQTIAVPGAGISAQANAKLAHKGDYEGKTGVLIWTSDRDNWIEYQIDVPQDGLFEMALGYHPYNDPSKTGSSAIRRPAVLSLQIDGEYPYREARALSFRRKFKDELPVKKDVLGDDVRPRPIELNEWMNSPLIDAGGAYAEPFRWYLTKGKHTLRFAGSDPIVIESLTLKPPTIVPSYAEVLASYPAEPIKTANTVTLQAEAVAWKNDVALQMTVDQDPLMVPKANGYQTFNSIGGDRWQTGGQTAAWTFDVPETGRYQIAMRSYQGFVSNMTVFRTIAIDGKVPFKELETFSFPYVTKWKGTVLGENQGKPFAFYLEKGTHTISMTATFAPFQPVIVQGERVMSLLRLVDEEIRAMTGGQVDKNRTWKVTQDFPEMPKQLEQAKAELQKMADLMLAANGRRDNTVQTIQTTMRDLDHFLRYPDEIPYYLDDISTMIERLGGVRLLLVKMPLELDQFYVVPDGRSLPKMEANFWQKMSGMAHNFVNSFTRKYDINTVDDDTLNVWVTRGRDYVNLLQELADDMFTPQTGIKVRVNLLPFDKNENLLVLSNAAGLYPDVALGQQQDKSIDFAMRGALLDLSKFPDFPQVAKQFAPGALVPFFYNGGYYALPETQSFQVLFYRKDILKRLGLKVPDTWEDVYDMLPTLEQNGYKFNLPPNDYLPFILQNGADFFAKNGMKTSLNTPEAFKGFKQWTDLYNIYNLEKVVPSFYQHFRKGDMPIGVADYNMYVTLSVAAPELAGWWGIAPRPGVKQPDGSVVRWAAGGQQTGFIYKKSKHPQEAWTFLKWLLSADVQARYGSDLESFNGPAFRWNTANVEAFTQLPWPKDDLKVILEQWRWYKEMPNLPGTYFIGREITNAWNRTVVDGMNYRESLEQAIVDIEREMVRKEQEFGFIDAQGNVLHTLDLPQITTPWEGVNQYVPK